MRQGPGSRRRQVFGRALKTFGCCVAAPALLAGGALLCFYWALVHVGTTPMKKSPDGRYTARLLYHGIPAHFAVSLFVKKMGAREKEVWRISPQLVGVSYGEDYVWSPDSRKIAVALWGENHDHIDGIYVYDLSTHREGSIAGPGAKGLTDVSLRQIRLTWTAPDAVRCVGEAVGDGNSEAKMRTVGESYKIRDAGSRLRVVAKREE